MANLTFHSVDAHTDELIQRIMREKFSNRTVISIVHKLESALDEFDAVVLLDAGELREYGPPRELLAQGPEASAFAALYESLATGQKDKTNQGTWEGEDEASSSTVASR